MVKTLKKHYKRRGGSSSSRDRNKSAMKIQSGYRKFLTRRELARRGSAFQKKHSSALNRTHKAKKMAKCIKIMMETFKTGAEWQEFLDEKAEREKLRLMRGF